MLSPADTVKNSRPSVDIDPMAVADPQSSPAKNCRDHSDPVIVSTSMVNPNVCSRSSNHQFVIPSFEAISVGDDGAIGTAPAHVVWSVGQHALGYRLCPIGLPQVGRSRRNNSFGTPIYSWDQNGIGFSCP